MVVWCNECFGRGSESIEHNDPHVIDILYAESRLEDYGIRRDVKCFYWHSFKQYSLRDHLVLLTKRESIRVYVLGESVLLQFIAVEAVRLPLTAIILMFCCLHTSDCERACILDVT